jgi:hypothetical protein
MNNEIRKEKITSLVVAQERERDFALIRTEFLQQL